MNPTECDWAVHMARCRAARFRARLLINQTRMLLGGEPRYGDADLKPLFPLPDCWQQHPHPPSRQTQTDG